MLKLMLKLIVTLALLLTASAAESPTANSCAVGSKVKVQGFGFAMISANKTIDLACRFNSTRIGWVGKDRIVMSNSRILQYKLRGDDWQFLTCFDCNRPLTHATTLAVFQDPHKKDDSVGFCHLGEEIFANSGRFNGRVIRLARPKSRVNLTCSLPGRVGWLRIPNRKIFSFSRTMQLSVADRDAGGQYFCVSCDSDPSAQEHFTVIEMPDDKSTHKKLLSSQTGMPAIWCPTTNAKGVKYQWLKYSITDHRFMPIDGETGYTFQQMHTTIDFTYYRCEASWSNGGLAFVDHKLVMQPEVSHRALEVGHPSASYPSEVLPKSEVRLFSPYEFSLYGPSNWYFKPNKSSEFQLMESKSKMLHDSVAEIRLKSFKPTDAGYYRVDGQTKSGRRKSFFALLTYVRMFPELRWRVDHDNGKLEIWITCETPSMFNSSDISLWVKNPDGSTVKLSKVGNTSGLNTLQSSAGMLLYLHFVPVANQFPISIYCQLENQITETPTVMSMLDEWKEEKEKWRRQAKDQSVRKAIASVKKAKATATQETVEDSVETIWDSMVDTVIDEILIENGYDFGKEAAREATFEVEKSVRDSLWQIMSKVKEASDDDVSAEEEVQRIAEEEIAKSQEEAKKMLIDKIQRKKSEIGNRK